MKNLLLIFALSFSCISAFNQDECKDKIYPVDNKNIIFDCCIYEVKEGNTVYYTREGDSLMIVAASITKDGRHIDLMNGAGQIENEGSPVLPTGLYKDHDYEYYQKIYKSATAKRGAGIVLTIMGVGIVITGIVIQGKDNNSMKNNLNGGALLALGFIFETIGIPLWISGGVKRANNKKAMEEIQKNMNLSFGASRYGIGLTLKF
jgi:hypothetical protein